MNRSDFLTGVRDVVPAIPPNVPFGMLFGATAADVGFDPLQATAMSVFIFAGAAQMAAVELLREDTVLPVVLATVIIINLRYVVYSASLAPLVRDLPARWRAVMGYGLFDVNYALATTTFRAQRSTTAPGDSDASDRGVHRGWYYLGVTIPMVLTLAAGTFVGAMAGSVVGRDLDLEFAIPLIFVALVVPMISDLRSALVAVVAGTTAVLGVGLPFGTGLLVATGCGAVAGIGLGDRRGSS